MATFLYQQYGYIQTFYTTCRSQGFVIISYYDKRAAAIAFSNLQNMQLENEKLNIGYLNPKVHDQNEKHFFRCLCVNMLLDSF